MVFRDIIASPHREVIPLALKLMEPLGPYWAKRNDGFYRSGDGKQGPPLSARFRADLAMGYLAYGLCFGHVPCLERIPGLVEAILAGQDASGGFRWNLPDGLFTHPDGVFDQVDLAMVVEALIAMLEYDLLPSALQRKVSAAVLRAAAFLAGMKVPHRPGMIRKRCYGEKIDRPLDVLNGDALAACVFDRVARLPGGECYADEVQPFIDHLQNRFGRHREGWWPYWEHWEPRALYPADDPVPTVFFQSMMVVHLRLLARRRGDEQLQQIVDQATDAVARFVQPDGTISPAGESRRECLDKPNALVADALGERHPELAMARLQRIWELHLRRDGGVTDEAGDPLEDKWRIWLFSDLARMLLAARTGFEPVHQP